MIIAPEVTSITPTSGPQTGKQIVDILGSNFGSSGPEIKSISMAGILCDSYDYYSRLLLPFIYLFIYLFITFVSQFKFFQ